MELAIHNCGPMHARITLRQCVANRESRHILCQACSGLKGDKGEVIMGAMATCKRCKHKKEIVAKGLCRTCYDALRHKGDLQAVTAEPERIPVVSVDNAVHPPVQALPEKTPPRSLLSLITHPLTIKTEGIFLDFSDRPGLLVDLEAISDNVPGDILELCSMLVTGKLRMVA